MAKLTQIMYPTLEVASPREPGEHATSYAFRMALEMRRRNRKRKERVELDQQLEEVSS